MTRSRSPKAQTPQEPSAMVEAISVSRVYRSGQIEVTALRQVDLVIFRGDLVAVMGPSGSGKTTLLNCLSGLDEVTSGEVIIEGTPLARMSDGERTSYRAKRMGFIFQAFNLLPVLSAVENVELPLLLSGRRGSESRRRAIEALETVGLGARAKHKPSELSAGEQQRVAVARAISPKPAVLWADEPTGNLDSENAQKIIDLLLSLNQEHGLTVVMVTHDAQVASHARRLIEMKDGEVLSPEPAARGNRADVHSKPGRSRSSRKS